MNAQTLLKKYGLVAKKSLGQNFLTDDKVLARIADAAQLSPDMGVMEIGPGLGALTRQLATRAGRVVCVEIDQHLLPVLSETLAEFDNITILHADALTLNWQEMQQTHFDGKPFALCANLPYYITSPLLMAALEGGAVVSPLVVLVQKEVAKRLCAKPGTADYGLLSLAAARYAKVEMLFDVAPGCFVPPPKVVSSVVRLTRRDDAPKKADGAAFFAVARAAFAMRRKTLENNLCAAFGASRVEVSAWIAACNLPPQVRGEALSGEQIEQLCKTIPQDNFCKGEKP